MPSKKITPVAPANLPVLVLGLMFPNWVKTPVTKLKVVTGLVNGKTRKLMTLVAVVLTFCLVSVEQLALAQSPNSNCKKLEGIRIDLFDAAAGIVFGTIGFLNGRTEEVINFNAGFVFTPDRVIPPLGFLRISTGDPNADVI